MVHSPVPGAVPGLVDVLSDHTRPPGDVVLFLYRTDCSQSIDMWREFLAVAESVKRLYPAWTFYVMRFTEALWHHTQVNPRGCWLWYTERAPTFYICSEIERSAHDTVAFADEIAAHVRRQEDWKAHPDESDSDSEEETTSPIVGARLPSVQAESPIRAIPGLVREWTDIARPPGDDFFVFVFAEEPRCMSKWLEYLRLADLYHGVKPGRAPVDRDPDWRACYIMRDDLAINASWLHDPLAVSRLDVYLHRRVPRTYVVVDGECLLSGGTFDDILELVHLNEYR